jgi:hypothetical protein
MKKQNRYLIISLGLIACWAIINLLFYYPSSSALGNGFTVAFMLILTRNITLIIGIITLLARLLYKNNTYLLYILTATLNLVIGISGTLLFFLQKINLPGLNSCLVNLLIGFICFTDTFILFRSVKNGH